MIQSSVETNPQRLKKRTGKRTTKFSFRMLLHPVSFNRFQPWYRNDYKTYIKGYVSKLIKKVAEEDADRAAFLKANLNEKFVMPMLKDFKLLRFYACDGDEYDLEGGIVYLKQDAPDGEEVAGTTCTAMILKDALFEEKC